METMTNQKMAAHAALLISRAPGQNEMVMLAAVISKGSVTSHDMA
jgi:hypothetical protein